MNQNVVGSIYERFSKELFLLGRFLKLFSETEPKKSKILQETSMKGPQDFLISSRLDKNMVTMGNSCF
jgi:hypothetical protein